LGEGRGTGTEVSDTVSNREKWEMGREGEQTMRAQFLLLSPFSPLLSCPSPIFFFFSLKDTGCHFTPDLLHYVLFGSAVGTSEAQRGLSYASLRYAFYNMV